MADEKNESFHQWLISIGAINIELVDDHHDCIWTFDHGIFRIVIMGMVMEAFVHPRPSEDDIQWGIDAFNELTEEDMEVAGDGAGLGGCIRRRSDRPVLCRGGD